MQGRQGWALPAAPLGVSTSDPHPWGSGSAPQLVHAASCLLCQVHPNLHPCLLSLLPEPPELPAGARPGSCWQLAVPTVSSPLLLAQSCHPRAPGSGRALPPASWALGQAASRAWTQWAAARACGRDPAVPVSLWRAVPCHGHRDGALLRFGQHSESSAHRNINVGVSWAPPAPGLAGVKVPAPHRSCWWHPGQAFLPKSLQELGLAASPGPGRDAQTGLCLLGQPHHFWALYPEPLELDE